MNHFRNLHHSNGLLLLPNAWNVKSALIFEEEKFPAVGTSSAAVAASLGYDDGEKIPFTDYFFMLSRIRTSVNIPLSADVEMGYGISNDAIADNILRLADIGVAGINIEDSLIGSSGRTLKNAGIFAKTASHIKNRLASRNADVFINVRSDIYLLDVHNKQQELEERLPLYEAAGADGIFLPCIAAEKDIAAAAGITKLPLNVMCIPGLPDFDTLHQLGVKRISMGPFLYNKVYENVAQLTSAIMANRNFSAILS